VAHFLKVASKFDTVLKDSFDLVKILRDMEFPEYIFMATMDITSPYTNMPTKHVLELLT
jgi:hypothetical protein